MRTEQKILQLEQLYHDARRKPEAQAKIVAQIRTLWPGYEPTERALTEEEQIEDFQAMLRDDATKANPMLTAKIVTQIRTLRAKIEARSE